MEDTYKVESYTECYIEVHQLHNLGVFQESYRRHKDASKLIFWMHQIKNYDQI